MSSAGNGKGGDGEGNGWIGARKGAGFGSVRAYQIPIPSQA